MPVVATRFPPYAQRVDDDLCNLGSCLLHTTSITTLQLDAVAATAVQDALGVNTGSTPVAHRSLAPAAAHPELLTDRSANVASGRDYQAPPGSYSTAERGQIRLLLLTLT